MKLMLHYTLKNKGLLFFNFICVFGFIIIELGLPTLLSQMIDVGVANNDDAYIKKIGLIMLAVVVVGVLMNISLGYFMSRITTNVTASIRQDLFEKIQGYSHNEYEQLGVPSLITRVTNDAYQIMLFMQNLLRTGFMTPMMFIASLVMVIRTSASLGAYVLAALPFLLIGVVAIARFSDPLSRKQQGNFDRLNNILRENLSGLRVIRAFVNEDFEEGRFGKVNDAFEKSSKNLFRLMSSAKPGFFFLFNTVMAYIIWQGSIQIDAGTLEVGNLIAFIEYIFHALFSFMMFSTIFMMYPRAAVSANRIQEAMDTEPIIENKENGVTTTETNGYLAFDDVTFAYPGHAEAPVIRDATFSAKPGETVAFIGSTGSGKSTLIQLIPRLYDVSEGEILVDGIDVRDYDIAALRQKIGYVPQKAVLFSGTLRENLLYGKKDATDEELYEAIDIAQASDFVSELVDGLDTQIAEGGSNFSGGQKQRLAIARAVVRRPDLYIFDDSFSALDFATDAKLRERIDKETTNATVLIVAQRVSTIMGADRIIVLNEGNIVGIGTHEELLKSSSVYYDIASSQLTKEELGQ
ncbi:ABC transporter ATP-binding protein [Tetragenococcus halophilus]|uniref:ABC transporter ATP-binding protein n=1 Tax=Tetragenococcus halophilus TaxID=51669 RepID=UPI00083D9D9C|nr:ABC transporter ATP-binding protein [Tetragenococcus halophilus]AOF48487.1 multidrug ABC transporter ATP-binding protein [Tetragenococcus halophilus]GFK28480.1 ABC transporter ATP-binding and permease protein [Tetragenococcus halophilus]GLL50946.1 multidrug ABC transporter ATP-binding protein [Tetragenococcus halophilus]